MSSRPRTAPRLTLRHLLGTAALAAVLGLGVTVSIPAGSASASPVAPAPAPASSTASSSGIAESAWRSRWSPESRSFFVDATAIARLEIGQISAAGLAGQVCTANHSGRACAQLVAYALRGAPYAVNPSTCPSTSGYTVVFPRIYQSHCGH
jgi:hypothetical protein